MDAYEAAFGGTLEATAEIVSLRATLRQSLPERKFTISDYPEHPVIGARSLSAWSFQQSEWQDFKLYNRSQLESGKTYQGPAIVTEQTTTTYIDSNDSFSSLENGCLLINHKGAKK